MSNEIVTRYEEGDWVAYMCSDPKMKGTGETQREAIGDLILRNAARFNISITH
jgi:hypothetical protein